MVLGLLPVFAFTQGATWETLWEAGKQADARSYWPEAETQYRVALVEAEKQWGEKDIRLCPILQSLAEVCLAQRKYSKAESHYRRAMALEESILGPNHPNL